MTMEAVAEIENPKLKIQNSTLPLLTLQTTESALECLLFVAGEPVPLTELARAVGLDAGEVEASLRSLQVSLAERGSGLQLLRIAGGWQLATRPEHAEIVARLMARGSNKLSRAAMETLAIVAYRQPVTAPEIEAVRGVSVGGVLKTLVERRLIVEAGRKATLGRPALYATTPDFLHYFGIHDLGQLPALEADAPAPAPVPADVVTHGRPEGQEEESGRKGEEETERGGEGEASKGRQQTN